MIDFTTKELNELLKKTKELIQKIDDNSGIFPKKIIENLPKDLQELCKEFNFNHNNKKRYACMLLLRRIIPLSIVRYFQQINKEGEIKIDGEYITTQELLGKIEKIIKEKSKASHIKSIKPLTDAAQHSYSTTMTNEDVEKSATKIRLFLESIFNENS